MTTTLLIVVLAWLDPGTRVPRIEPGDDPARVVVSIALDAAPSDDWAEGKPVDESTGQQWLRLGIVDEPSGRVGEPLFGRYEHRHGRLIFVPRRGLVPGCLYRAEAFADGRVVAATAYRVPLPPATEAAIVEAIFPSGDEVPANLLKFYVHFSRPMREGREVFDHVRLVDEHGREVPDPWRPTELWSADARRLTLWVHPGRVKTGVNLREQIGPVLVPGGRYTLVVGAGLRDAAGQPLARDAGKSFTARDADHGRPLADAPWQVTAPRAATRDAVNVAFPEPLDCHLLERSLEIRDAGGHAIAGVATLGAAERSWRFVPSAPWLAADYALHVDERLEDLAGNTPRKPFEVDRQATPANAPTLRIRFRPTDARTSSRTIGRSPDAQAVSFVTETAMGVD